MNVNYQGLNSVEFCKFVPFDRFLDEESGELACMLTDTTKFKNYTQNKVKMSRICNPSYH